MTKFCCGVRYCNKEILEMIILHTRETCKTTAHFLFLHLNFFFDLLNQHQALYETFFSKDERIKINANFYDISPFLIVTIFVSNIIDPFVEGIHKNCVFFKIILSVNKRIMFNIGDTIICISLLVLFKFV